MRKHATGNPESGHLSGHQPELKAGADEKRTIPSANSTGLDELLRSMSIGHEGEARGDT